MHDAELDATPELVHAAASAAALALDNERLKADLRARLEELRHSRRRIVEAADDARRQIERDLHDGAQQQLVSLALDLRLLRARLKEQPEEAATVEELTEKLNVALAELRELARGIHPAVLSDHGLAPAIHVLVERVSLPIECDLAFEGRLPAPIEAAAYFVVAEGLTNVIKYANAEHARVSLRRHGDALDVDRGRRRRRRRADRRRLGPARPQRPARGARGRADGREPDRRGHAPHRPDPDCGAGGLMRRLLLVLALVALAGCGQTSTLPEQDLVARGGDASPAAAGDAPARPRAADRLRPDRRRQPRAGVGLVLGDRQEGRLRRRAAQLASRSPTGRPRPTTSTACGG